MMEEYSVSGLPDSMRVGPFDVAIIIMTHAQASARDVYGEFSAREMELRIAPLFPSAIKAAHTLIHELGHAVYYVFGIEDDDKEERIVSLSARGWCAVYRDNPWLLDWLKAAVS